VTSFDRLGLGVEAFAADIKGVTSAAREIEPGAVPLPAARAAPLWLVNIGQAAVAIGLGIAVDQNGNRVDRSVLIRVV